MKALVTGATGFVGSHLAEALRSRGDEVTALVRSPSKAAALGPLGVSTLKGDISGFKISADGSRLIVWADRHVQCADLACDNLPKVQKSDEQWREEQGRQHVRHPDVPEL